MRIKLKEVEKEQQKNNLPKGVIKINHKLENRNKYINVSRLDFFLKGIVCRILCVPRSQYSKAKQMKQQ